MEKIVVARGGIPPVAAGKNRRPLTAWLYRLRRK